MNRFNIKTIAIQISILFFAIAPTISIAQEPPNSILVFSAGWRTDDAKPENILQLGTIYHCNENWCGQVEDFHGRLNLQRTSTQYRHEMKEHSHATGCSDEKLTTVIGNRSKEQKARLSKKDTALSFDTGGLHYEWIVDEKNINKLQLKAITKPGNPEIIYSQPTGFAYWSEETRGTAFQRKMFDAHFDGTIAHKDTLTDVFGEWNNSETSIDFRKFSNSELGNPVLSLTQSSQPTVQARFKKRIEVQNSILPPTTSNERLNYFIHEYGHDFNGNGCFDDFGHNKLMLPAMHLGAVDAFVFIEYTFDKLDGIPMLSVGSYYKNYSR